MKSDELVAEYESRTARARESVSLISRDRALNRAASSVTEWLESLPSDDLGFMIEYLANKIKK
jgi:hypothetical protein